MQNAYASYQFTQLIGRFSWLPGASSRSRRCAVAREVGVRRRDVASSGADPARLVAPARLAAFASPWPPFRCACLPEPAGGMPARAAVPRRSRTGGSGPPSPGTCPAGSCSRSPGSASPVGPPPGSCTSGSSVPPATSRLVQQLSLPLPQLVIPAPPGAQLGGPTSPPSPPSGAPSVPESTPRLDSGINAAA